MGFSKAILYFFLIAGVGATLGCAKKNVPASTEKYEKNLKSMRPHYTYVEPVIEKSKEPVKKEPAPYRLHAAGRAPVHYQATGSRAGYYGRAE